MRCTAQAGQLENQCKQPKIFLELQMLKAFIRIVKHGSRETRSPRTWHIDYRSLTEQWYFDSKIVLLWENIVQEIEKNLEDAGPENFWDPWINLFKQWKVKIIFGKKYFFNLFLEVSQTDLIFGLHSLHNIWAPFGAFAIWYFSREGLANSRKTLIWNQWIIIFEVMPFKVHPKFW